jgi:hypothetical protein
MTQCRYCGNKLNRTFGSQVTLICSACLDQPTCCPHCNAVAELKVIDSRRFPGGWRRVRKCEVCKGRFVTLEMVSERVQRDPIRTAWGTF